MNKRLVLSLLGKLSLVEVLLLAPPLTVSLIYGQDDWLAFILTMLLLLAFGLFLIFISRPKIKNLRARDGFAVVALAWLCISLFGSLPYMFSGAIPSFADAFFESVSGFTTTGATVLAQIEGLPYGILFWRAFTHWIGGMGVLVLTLALTPKLTGRTAYLMRAETSGPSMSKLMPRLGDTAKLLYVIYLVMTFICILCFRLAGMNWYDAIVHSFSTAGTGGFSNKNLSVGAYDNPAIDAVATVFMLLFSINFAVYFWALMGDWKKALKNEELIAFVILVAAVILVISFNILPNYGGSFITAFRYASFQVASLISTTGYYTANYELWPQISQHLLILVMFIGGCAGSTAGGLKIIRLLYLAKSGRREVQHTFMPRRVAVVKMDGKAVENEVLGQVAIFFFAYVCLTILSALCVSFSGQNFTTSLTASIATISNTGPGLHAAGPTLNYSGFSAFVKYVLSFNMLAGRLEIFPLMVLVSPSAWRKQ